MYGNYTVLKRNNVWPAYLPNIAGRPCALMLMLSCSLQMEALRKELAGFKTSVSRGKTSSTWLEWVTHNLVPVRYTVKRHFVWHPTEVRCSTDFPKFQTICVIYLTVLIPHPKFQKCFVEFVTFPHPKNECALPLPLSPRRAFSAVQHHSTN
jgi:hypothetical protein